MKSTYTIPALPLHLDVESTQVLKALTRASRSLAELKGREDSLPNKGILVDTLALQEAQASSEIENYVTTQDQVFQLGQQKPSQRIDPNEKEVARYRDALKCGYKRLMSSDGLLTNNTIIEMYRVLKEKDDGFRLHAGTALAHDVTKEIVYVPPQHPENVRKHMAELEQYINTPDIDQLDPLIRMAIIHHQFESIHPFSDGNGRIGRLINVLYLVKMDLLQTPSLYLSRYITRNKAGYYRLLQHTRDTGHWEDWILYMLEGVEVIATETTMLIEQIKIQMAELKTRMRKEFPSMYSQDLLNNLFRHPYTKIAYVMDELGCSRPTATRYLSELHKAGLLERLKSGRDVYYVNVPLVNLFYQGSII